MSEDNSAQRLPLLARCQSNKTEIYIEWDDYVTDHEGGNRVILELRAPIIKVVMSLSDRKQTV
jgi:hypothetical protein